jgi:poly-gamma-glutamate capsule biosynthesis protein CapA/YwtB (metallophosphatase superfamily)
MRYKSVLIIIILVFFFISEKVNKSKAQEDKASGESDSLITISLSVVGDMMCHSVQFNYAHVEDDSFNFNPVFSEIKNYLLKSDFVFGNLETVTAGENKKYSGYPFFNSPDDFISAIKNSGFDLLSTANNHALDKGEPGVRRTIQQLKDNGLFYNGTFLSQKDRDSIRIYNIYGIKVAFLAYTYGTNGISVPKRKDYLINLISPGLISKDIKEAREQGTDFVVVHFHFGEEYKREPTSYQNEIVKKTIEAGADIIIGGHPHVLEPIKYFKSEDPKLDSGFVAYSMGNFISNQRWRYSDGGAVLTFYLTKNLSNDSLYISSVNYLPIWVFKGKIEAGNHYKIIPAEAAFSDTAYSFLTPADRKFALQSFYDTQKILTKYSVKPKLVKFYNNTFVTGKDSSFR